MTITLTFTIGRWPGVLYVIKEGVEAILRLANVEAWTWKTEVQP